MTTSWYSKAAVHVRCMALAGGVILTAASLPATAANTIHVWHALNAHNAALLETLVKRFNKNDKDARVKLSSFDDTAAIGTALAAARKDADRPHLVQLDESHLTDLAAAKRDDIQPLHVLLARHHPVKDSVWFLPAKSRVLRDGKGRLQAFPYMLDIPVMYYNIGSFEQAGLSPAAPARSWTDLQGQVVSMANQGSRRCPITSDQPVSINLENLAAVNKQPFVSQKKGGPLFNFDSLYIRHLSLMISWVRSELLVKPDFNDVAAQRFADGECAVLLSQSSNLGWFASQRGLTFGVSGLPYYPEVTQQPGLPFIGGSALWAVSGHAQDDDAVTADFLAWLAEPEQARYWFEQTGFLPLTHQAFEDAGRTSGAEAQWRELAAPYGHDVVASAHGLQIQNYPEVRALLGSAMGRALSGQEPAVTALKGASDQASKLGSGK